MQPILNPLVLYKNILKLHRKLPVELRLIGNKYLRDEFKRHKTAEMYYVGMFMREWNNYYSQLSQQVNLTTDILVNNQENPLTDTLVKNKQKKEIGKKLDRNVLEGFTDAQMGQLFELREAATTPSNNSKNSSALNSQE